MKHTVSQRPSMFSCLLLIVTATATIADACTMVDVVRAEMIPWDPDSEDITILTDSVAGNNEQVEVVFFDDNNQRAGAVGIWFSSPIHYSIGLCSEWLDFPVTPPTPTDKTWRVVYNQDELRMMIYCNEVEVLNLVLSDSVCLEKDVKWRDYWEQEKPTKINFDVWKNTASDKYCLAESPLVAGTMVDVVIGDMIPWDPDSEDITILTDTDSVAGSYEQLKVVFVDDDNEWAGDVGVRFSSPLEFRVGRCIHYTPFTDSPPAETEKTWIISYDQPALSLSIHCNGVEMVDMVLSDSVCFEGDWRTIWEQRKPTQIKFNNADRASDQYSLTPTIAESCTMLDVVLGAMTPWDPDSEDITILTDSVAGGNEMVYVLFFDGTNQWAGAVLIWFTPQINYQIVWCTALTLFPASLPTEADRTWRVVYNQDELRMLIYCNEVEMVNVVLSDEVCTNDMEWRDYWEQRKPAKINFHSRSDTASDQFCLQGKVDDVVCTGLDLAWNNLQTDALFPLVQGTVVTVTCDIGYELEGSNTVTCIKDTDFENHPTCKNLYYLGISSLKKITKIEDHICPGSHLLADYRDKC